MAPSTPHSHHRQARRYGFACANCKARKVKCSGNQPICRACERSGEPCTWPGQSSTDQTAHLKAHIRHLEHQLKDTESRAGATTPRISSSEAPAPVTTTPVSAADLNQPLSPPLTRPSQPQTTSPSVWYEVGVGEDGAVTYHGPTSRFHAGPVGKTGDDDEQSIQSDVETLRSQYTLMESVWMPLIRAKPSMSGVETNLGLTLLDIYWTWLHPLHNCVYRPVMLMDLALGGPYCSDFLIMCIFALAARHLPENHFEGVGRGESFITRAKELLLVEMSAPVPSIATVQGLLILSGRQSAAGKSSEGWLYAGMAIRIMTDLGLHLNPVQLVGLQRWTPAEIETRKRLYNSAYIWDKTLSLALGRPPSLTRPPCQSHEILDRFDDEGLWIPVHATEVVDTLEPTPFLNWSCFCAFSSLHEITTEIMLLFSGTTSNNSFTAEVQELDTKLVRWFSAVNPRLVILTSGDDLGIEQSYPPHIVSLNLLYHTLHIILRRPALSAVKFDHSFGHLSRDLDVCLNHSKKIHEIHRIFSRTFPHRLMTYQVSYCVYMASTIEAYVLKTATVSNEERQGAAVRLTAAVKSLQDEAAHTPGSGRSLDTIRRLLGASHKHISAPPSEPSVTNPQQQQQLEGRHDQRRRSTSLQGFGERRRGGVNAMTSAASQDEADGRMMEEDNHEEADAAILAAPEDTMTSRDLAIDQQGPQQQQQEKHADDIASQPGVWTPNIGDVSYFGTDTGAGFHPNSFSWRAGADTYSQQAFQSFSWHM